MTSNQAINEAYRLMKTWVGEGRIDLKRIQSSIKDDIKATTISPARMTPACLTQCRNDRKIIGQIIKNYPWIGDYK